MKNTLIIGRINIKRDDVISGAEKKWFDYYYAWKHSKLKRCKWCELNGVNYSTFANAIVRLKKKGLLMAEKSTFELLHDWKGKSFYRKINGNSICMGHKLSSNRSLLAGSGPVENRICPSYEDRLEVYLDYLDGCASVQRWCINSGVSVDSCLY